VLVEECGEATTAEGLQRSISRWWLGCFPDNLDFSWIGHGLGINEHHDAQKLEMRELNKRF
jgi:hypothetical protein